MEFEGKGVEFNFYDSLEHPSNVFEICSEDVIDFLTHDSLDLHDESKSILLSGSNINEEKFSQLGVHLVVEEKYSDPMHKKKALKPLKDDTNNTNLPPAYFELCPPILKALKWELKQLFNHLGLLNYLLSEDH